MTLRETHCHVIVGITYGGLPTSALMLIFTSSSTPCSYCIPKCLLVLVYTSHPQVDLNALYRESRFYGVDALCNAVLYQVMAPSFAP